MLKTLREIPTREASQLLLRIAQADVAALGRFYAKIKAEPFLGNQMFDADDLPGPCWIWNGYVHSSHGDSGYGHIKVKGRVWRSHVWIATVMLRDVKIEEDVHHDCEVSRCVNPWHLSIVPAEDHSKRGPPSNYMREEVAPF